MQGLSLATNMFFGSWVLGASGFKGASVGVLGSRLLGASLLKVLGTENVGRRTAFASRSFVRKLAVFA
jgi:hypothetical protein